LENLRRELELLIELDHPNIIKLHEIFEDSRYIHIVTDACNGGDLFSKIAQREKLTEREASSIMRKLLSAVSHMHNSNVVHRDIKPENVMFVDDSPDSEVKIIDLGLANTFRT
jgi:calcium-dependent protein kinase